MNCNTTHYRANSSSVPGDPTSGASGRKPPQLRLVNDIDHPWRRLPYGLKGFRVFCSHLVLENGEPFVLEAHEVDIVRDHFNGARRVVVVIGKKNGKTTLLAALSLYHLDMVPSPNALIAASTRDQATLLFEQAEGLVVRSELEGIYKVQGGYRRIQLHDRPGRLKVLAGDVDTADGQIPTLALVDELHRHRSRELMATLFLGLVPRNGQMLVISTAGARLDSPLGELRAEAHALPSFRRDYKRKRNYARSEDGALVWHEWCLDPTDNVEDMRLVKKVNPASWHTLSSLREYRGGVRIGEWLRFACGIWTEGEEPWLDPQVWDALAVPGLEVVPEDDPIWIGLNSSGVEQDAGLALVARRGEDYVVSTIVLKPPIRRPVLEARIRELAETFKPVDIVYTKTNFERSGELLEEAGLPMTEFPLSEARVADASATLLGVIEAGRLHHSGDGELRAHVMAAQMKQGEYGWRLQRDPKANANTGALVAMMVAIRVAEYSQDRTYWVL